MIVSRLLVIVFLLTLVVAVACTSSGGDSDGGDDGAQSTTTSETAEATDAPEQPTSTVDPNAEDDLARSLLLDVNDFPTGWAETPADEEEDNPFDECDEGPAAGRTGSAETGQFSSGGSEAISHDVGVFDTPENGSSALDRLPSRADCIVELINDGALDDDEAEYSDATFGNLSFPSLGDRTEARRLEFQVKAKGESGFGSEGTLYLDLIYVVEGRLAFFILAADVFSPFDISILESTVRNAYEKLASAEPVRSTQ